MRKTYQMFVAFMLCMFGATNVNAEEISLNEIPFWQHEAWGLDEPKNTQIEVGSEGCHWVLGEATDLPYGASNVNDFADVSAYKELVVTLVDGTDGSPRFLFNRDADEGQWNAEEAESHLIDNTKGGWSSKYFTQDGNVYTVNIKQIVKDKGYAYLHAIKSASWGSTVTIESMVLVSQGKVQQVGWVDLITNGDLEGDDVSCFFTKVNKGEPQPSEITDGVGNNGSRGIVVNATAKVSDAWDNQFWIRFPEVLPKDTKYRVTFDYKADAVAKASTQAHAEPSDYIHHQMLGDVEFATDWQTFTKEDVVTAEQAGPNGGGNYFQSIAFNLSELADANNYYFDNIKFEVYKYGTTAEFSNDVIEVYFGFETNIPELVEQAGAMRVFFPKSCASVKVNGVEKEIFSIEGLKDGRFYIFMEEAIDDRATVEVTVNNTIGLIYASGANMGSPVADFNGIATWNDAIEDNEGYPYIMVTPTLMKSDPEDGSFNLTSSTPITLYFDKDVDCKDLEVTANGSPLSKSPADGFAKEVTVSGSLPEGEVLIEITKVYPTERLDDTIFGEFSFTLNIGQSTFDPSVKPEEIIPVAYFDQCAAGSVPEGYILYADGETPEERLPGGNYGSGARMFDFSAGGDFTKGLYMRTWYLEYGSTEGHEVNLSAGTKYRTTFNSCQWNSGGHWMKFAIYNVNDTENPVFSQMVENSPNVNESRNAVTGTTSSAIDFTPESDGQYIVRWIVCTGSDGTPTNNGWQNGVILANVKMMSMPNTAGYEYFLLLTTALEKAKKALEENGAERYHGEAYATLQAAISQYESEMAGYHGPTAFNEAAAALEAASLALSDHRKLCDEYDTQIKKAIDVIRKNEMPDGDPSKATKFVTLELFAQLKAIVAKYNGTSEWQNLGDEENENWVLNYSFDVLTDDDALKAAIDELKDIANLTSLLFTEGESKGTDTGVKVVLERLRRGVETLKALGLPDDSSLFQRYNQALTDDDELAEDVKARIKSMVYSRLANPDNDLFQGVVNEETMEETTPVYDMTVFIKNPNVYKVQTNLNLNPENVPGWETTGSMGLWCGWNGATKNIEGVAEDCAFTIYHAEGTAEQTIYDLPAATYNVIIDAARWDNVDPSGSTFAYIKTSATGDDYAETQDLAYYGQYVMNHDNVFENIEITDGQLTVGVNFASDEGQYFCDKVTLQMVGPARNFDYAAAQGIEKTEVARVNSVELFDLNGRRIQSARPGVVIVKKHLSDGSVKAEKLVRK